jgi:hypothetical protein
MCVVLSGTAPPDRLRPFPPCHFEGGEAAREIPKTIWGIVAVQAENAPGN